jgi:PAS domain S-box-containing protein
LKLAPAEPIRIWIVEDELMIAKALQQGLGHLGHSIVHIVPGSEADLEAPADSRPDLALVDLDPTATKDRAQRIALARRLRDVSNVPTVFVSSTLDDTLVSAADSVEPFGYLQKPVSEGELKLTIDFATRRLLAERELRNRNLQQEALRELERFALAGHDLNSLLEQTVRAVAKTLGTRFSRALRFLPEGNCLLLTHGVGWKPGLVGASIVNAGRGSLSGYAIEQEQPVIAVDLRHETRFFVPPVLREHNVISSLTTVIRGPDGPYGCLGADSDSPRLFTYNEIQFLESLASLVSQAIARLHAELGVQEASDYTKAVIDHLPPGFVSLDEDGVIVDWNPASESIFGWSREQIIGLRLGETLLSPSARARYDELDARLSSRAITRLFHEKDMELPLVDRNGKEVPTQASFFSVRRGTGYRLNAFLVPLNGTYTKPRQYPRHSDSPETSLESGRSPGHEWSDNHSSRKHKARNA